MILKHKEKIDNNKDFVIVTTNSNSLNVRQKPSSSSRVIASLFNGSKVPFITKNNPINASNTWFKVEYSKGRYGWVHSRYSKVIKQPLNIKIAQSDFLIETDNKGVISKTKQLSISKTLDGSNNIINLLRKRIRDITIDKAQAIKSRNQARAILEKKILSSSIEINNLKTSSASLSKELIKTKSEKSTAILVAKQNATKAQADILASNKKFDDLSAKSSNEIRTLKTNTASLKKSLERVNSEKSAALLAAKQDATKAQADILASNKKFDDLSTKSSNEISSLKATAISLKKSLERVNSEKSAALLAAKQDATKAQNDILASNIRFDDLSAKSSNEIRTLKTNTASLKKSLERVNSEKSAALLAAKQDATKAQNDILASNIRFDDLSAKSSNEISNLKTTAASLNKELEKTKSEKSTAILVATQDATKAQNDILASNIRFDDLSAKSSNEIRTLKTNTASLKKSLERVNSEKSAALIASKEAATKAQAGILASNKRFDDLTETSSQKISSLKTNTITLKKELEKTKSEKTAAILAAKQEATKSQADILASNKKFDDLTKTSSQKISSLKTNAITLKKELIKTKSEKTAAILAAKQEATKSQADILASNIRFDDLSAKSSNEIRTLKTNTASLKKSLERVNSEKSAALLAAKQDATKAQNDILASNIRFDDLSAKSSNEIRTLKTNTASLKKSLERVNSEKSTAILVAKQNATKAQADILASNIRFDDLSAKSSNEIRTLKTNTASLKKSLERVKSEKSTAILVAKQNATKAQADILASNKKFDDLSTKSSNEISSLKATAISLKNSLERVNSEKSAAFLVAKQNATKAQNDILASNIRFDDLSAKSSNVIRTLKTNTASLKKSLERVESEKSAAILAAKQDATKAQAGKIAHSKAFEEN